MLGRSRVFAGVLAVVAFLASPDGVLDGPSVAEARVSIAYTLPQLVDAAPWTVVGTAVENKSSWEQVEGSRRIVTYTKVRIDQRIYGKDVGETIWVRHLGGAVGRIGQQVAGEAVLRLREPALLFLTRVEDDIFTVSGAAQGHFPLRLPDAAKEVAKAPSAMSGPELKRFRAELGERHLALNPSMGKLVRRAGPVVTVQEALKGKKLAAAIELLRETKAARDAKKSESP
jgi:hypothetical protein